MVFFKYIFVYLSFVIFMTSCGFNQGEEEGLISGHKEANNALTINTITPQIYTTNDIISITFTFPYTLSVSGSPQISFDLGGVTKYAVYSTGDQTHQLTFEYTVQAGDNDTDGIELSTSIDLNGGSITFIESGVQSSIDLVIDEINTSSVIVLTSTASVTIDSPANITSANASNYTLTGTCSENGQNVVLSIDSSPLTVTCNSSSWFSGVLDLSSHADNASFTITANHSDIYGYPATTATAIISKDTATPIVTINTPTQITSSNETNYTLTGTCTDNGIIVDIFIDSLNIQPNCSGGAWSTGILDVSSLSEGTLSITADHNGATQASSSVLKDTLSPEVTLSTPPNISLGNELSYLLSGTCSENSTNVDLDIGGITLSVSCSSNSWSSGSIDVSSLSDGSIVITVDHSTAPQVSTTVSKNTSTPSISSLSAPSSLSSSIDLNWTLNDPGGFSIDDYEIQYKSSGSSTWLSFSDGVSTNLYATVNSLAASSSYELRVRVVYDTSNYSDWSQTTTGTTQPDDPLFSSPYAVMNVGGATSTSVVAMYDNTNVTLNGVAIAGSPLSKGVKVTITTAQFDVLDADKPIYAAGILGSGADGSKANIVWNSVGWAGKAFSFNATRANPQNLHVYATENTTITVKQGSTVLDTITLTAGSGGTLSWSVYGSYQVSSSGSMLAYHMSGSGTTRYDPKPIMPGYTEMIGFPSASMRLTTMTDSTSYQLYHSDSTLSSGTLDKQNVKTISPQGTSSLYQSESLLIKSNQKISGASFADSNGLCASPFLPTNLMKTRYIINVDASYVAFASKQAGTIDVYAPADTIGVSTPVQTLTLSNSGGDSQAPFKARLGTTTSGYRFVSSVPMAAWYHPSVDDGSAKNDETILIGTND